MALVVGNEKISIGGRLPEQAGVTPGRHSQTSVPSVAERIRTLMANQWRAQAVIRNSGTDG